MLIHTKGVMVQFQRAYHHGCSPTSIIHALIPHHEYAKGHTVPFKGDLFPQLSDVHAALNAWVPFL